MAGCHDTRSSEALLVLVKVHAAQAANCVALEVLTPGGPVLHSEYVPRPSDKAELRIALFREQLPEEVELQARPLWSPDCKATAAQARPNGPVSEKVRARFVQEPERAELVVGAPANDTDEDGFADSTDGGPDCVDTRNDTHPAATERCTENVDRDCNNLRGCEDPACANQECLPVASALAFVDPPAAAPQAGECEGPFTVQRQDALGRAAPLDSVAQVRLESTLATDLTFYADASCGSTISQVYILAGESRASFYLRPVRTGAVTLTATVDGLGNTTSQQNVLPGPPTRLLYATPAHTVTAGACSPVIALSLKDRLGNDTPNDQERPLTITLPPRGQFYSDSTCSQALSSVSFGAGQNTVGVHLRASQAGTYTLAVSASPLQGTQQSLTVRAGAPAELRFTSTAQTLLTGACSGEMLVRVQDAHDNVVNVAQSTPLTVTGNLGLSLFSDATCQTPLTNPAVPASSSQLRFFFKGRTAGSLTLQASGTDLQAHQLTHTVLPTVRTGTCQLNASGSNITSVDCPIVPALLNRNRSLLVFQAANESGNPSEAFIRCHLTDTQKVTCMRDGGGTAATIRWQVAEFPSGVTVQHILKDSCDGGTTQVAITRVNNLGSTFVLSSTAQNGSSVGGDDLFTVRLVSDSRVDIDSSSGSCWAAKYALQVVEMSGATVTRGQSGSMNGEVVEVKNQPTVDRSRTLLLYTWRSNPGNSKVCDRLIRGEMTSDTAMSFYRGLGDTTNCTGAAVTVAWERVQLPAGVVQQVHMGMSPGSAETRTTLTTPVDRSRTLVLAGGQNFGGQAAGETAFYGDDIIGAGMARHELTSANELKLDRSHTVGTANFTSYVVELVP
jgi:hypothetical protein